MTKQKIRIQAVVRKDGKVSTICPCCGITHSSKTTKDLQRWWKAHRTLSEESA